MKRYLITIRGNDVFTYDFKTSASSNEELFEKIHTTLKSLSKQTIETLYLDMLTCFD